MNNIDWFIIINLVVMFISTFFIGYNLGRMKELKRSMKMLTFIREQLEGLEDEKEQIISLHSKGIKEIKKK